MNKFHLFYYSYKFNQLRRFFFSFIFLFVFAFAQPELELCTLQCRGKKPNRFCLCRQFCFIVRSDECVSDRRRQHEKKLIP